METLLIVMPLISLSCWIVAHVATCRYLRVSPHVSYGDDPLPPVSILRPIKGLDANGYDNLLAMAKQDYPHFEFVIGIQDGDPIVCAAVEALKAEVPECNITVVMYAPERGQNPKVNNLRHMAAAAHYNLWLISDADVQPNQDYLKKLVSEKRSTGAHLVHSPLYSQVTGTLGAQLEALHLTDFVSASVGVTARLGHHCVVGKSMLFEQRDLEKVGGFQAVADILAEDYIMGKNFQAYGYKVHLATEPVAVRNEERSVGAFLSRHSRWSKMRLHVDRCAYPFELLLQPTIWIVMSGILAVSFGVWMYLSVLFWVVVALVVKLSVNYGAYYKITGHPLTLLGWPHILFKDGLIFAVWLYGLVSNTINWRGRKMRVLRGSVLVAHEPFKYRSTKRMTQFYK